MKQPDNREELMKKLNSDNIGERQKYRIRAKLGLTIKKQKTVQEPSYRYSTGKWI